MLWLCKFWNNSNSKILIHKLCKCLYHNIHVWISCTKHIVAYPWILLDTYTKLYFPHLNINQNVARKNGPERLIFLSISFSSLLLVKLKILVINVPLHIFFYPAYHCLSISSFSPVQLYQWFFFLLYDTMITRLPIFCGFKLSC